MLNSLKRLINVDIPTVPTYPGGPELSIIVIVYDMPRQAQRTLQSLTAQYQEGVSERDYEVIVVENQSARTMDRDFISSLPDNFSYHLRAEREPTPVHAINHGVGISRGRFICIMIDGARMVTPGVVRNILRGHRMEEKAVVTVPGYHIGEKVQQDAVEQGYGVEEDQALIESTGWPMEGYRLFDIACFSGSCDPGFFLPNSESNCISVPRDIWARLGGMDTRFNLRGGGLVRPRPVLAPGLVRRRGGVHGLRGVLGPRRGLWAADAGPSGRRRTRVRLLEAGRDDHGRERRGARAGRERRIPRRRHPPRARPRGRGVA